MARTLKLEPRVRTRVIRRGFSSLPQVFEFTASAEQGGEVSGTVERVGSRWILGRTNTSFPLRSHNEVRKGYWDTIFEVFVTSDTAIRVAVTRPRLTHRLLIGTLVAAVVVAAAAVLYFAK